MSEVSPQVLSRRGLRIAGIAIVATGVLAPAPAETRFVIGAIETR